MRLGIEILASLGLAALLLYAANRSSIEWRTKRILTVAILVLLVIWLVYIVAAFVGVIPQS